MACVQYQSPSVWLICRRLSCWLLTTHPADKAKPHSTRQQATAAPKAQLAYYVPGVLTRHPLGGGGDGDRGDTTVL